MDHQVNNHLVTNFSDDNQSVRIYLQQHTPSTSFEELNTLIKQIIDAKQIKIVVVDFDQSIDLDIIHAKYLVNIAKELTNSGILVIFHALTNTQQTLFNNQDVITYDNKPPYIQTTIENEVKTIFDTNNIKYVANSLLKQGIKHFQANYIFNRTALLNNLAKAQYPHTLLITCSDSRLDPNKFFAGTLGELFIVRNVGNVVPPYSPDDTASESAAIEFALNALNIRNIVICAHTECGAVKTSINPDNTGYKGLDNWLQIIKHGFSKTTPKDAKHGVELNLLNQIEHLKTYPVVNELLNKKELTVSAWIYDVHTANVLEYDGTQFVTI